MFSFICVWINGWINNREASDLRRHRAHYDVTVMLWGSVNRSNDMDYASLWFPCVGKVEFQPPSPWWIKIKKNANILYASQIIHRLKGWYEFSLVSGQEYCLAESFTASCEPYQVLLMTRAQFGRMNLGRCVTKNYGHIGCAQNVLPQLDVLCSGRHSCTFSVSDAALVRTKPCPQDFASYLEANYECIKGGFLLRPGPPFTNMV